MDLLRGIKCVLLFAEGQLAQFDDQPQQAEAEQGGEKREGPGREDADSVSIISGQDAA